MSKMLRYFVFSSVLAVPVMSVLLGRVSYQVGSSVITEIGENSNIILTKTFANALRARLSDVGHSSTDTFSTQLQQGPFIQILDGLIEDLRESTAIHRVKVYDLDGTTVYSTDKRQIGQDQSSNPGFRSARAGKVTSLLTYRNTLNEFEQDIERTDVIHSYVPLREPRTGQIAGVFELYSEVAMLVQNMKRTVVVIVTASTLLTILLCTILFFFLRRPTITIERQNDIIRANARELEHLNHRLLIAQETEKKYIAMELHDAIGQGLSAIKFRLEAIEEQGKETATGVINSIVPMLQDLIEETRRLGMTLRPPMLDDLGLLATISWFCREFQTTYTTIETRKTIEIKEQDIPKHLAIVIYRVLQEACNNVARHSKATKVDVSLRTTDQHIELTVTDNGTGFDITEVESRESMVNGFGFVSMKERAKLFGGSLMIESTPGNGTVLRATWPTASNEKHFVAPESAYTDVTPSA